MNLLIRKLTKYGFNRKFMTEEDAYKICEMEGIDVRENQEFTGYLVIDGKPYIALKRGLRGIKKLRAFFHEIGHHFLHAGKELNEIFLYGEGDSKQEFEADAVATIALVPSFALQSHDFLEDHPNETAQKLYKDRQSLKFLYKVK